VSVAVEKLDGVLDADVSLNEGRVRVTFAMDHAITVRQLREVIRGQGFSPKEAIVTVAGQVLENPEGRSLHVPGSGVTYALGGDLSELSGVSRSAEGSTVLVGTVGEDEEERTPQTLVLGDPGES